MCFAIIPVKAGDILSFPLLPDESLDKRYKVLHIDERTGMAKVRRIDDTTAKVRTIDVAGQAVKWA